MIEGLVLLLEGDKIGLMISIFVFAAAVAIFLAFAFVLIPVLQTQKRLDLELVNQGFGGRHDSVGGHDSNTCTWSPDTAPCRISIS